MIRMKEYRELEFKKSITNTFINTVSDFDRILSHEKELSFHILEEEYQKISYRTVDS